MHYLYGLLDYILHIDVHLNAFVSHYGFWSYFALFLIIFCETGLVITPFLPGDSLLFAAGSIAAQPESALQISLLFLILSLASILGNQINFFMGRLLGPRMFSYKQSWLLNQKHLQKTHQFYEKHGRKTIIFARFLPIIRTFAPFVAGIASMNWLKFTSYNVFSAILWIGSLLFLGYFLGSIPTVREHFVLVIYGIIIISLLPPLISVLHSKKYNH